MSQTSSRPTIVAIGDSITYGFPYDPADSWVNLVSRRLSISIVNRGVCGETTADMLDRFESEVLSERPSIVIITGGSNDAFYGIRSKAVHMNMREMLDMARLKSVKPVIGLPPPILGREEELLADYRASYVSLAAECNVLILDFYTPFLDTARGQVRTDRLVDEVHPNPSGYAAMADAAHSLLCELVNGYNKKE